MSVPRFFPHGALPVRLGRKGMQPTLALRHGAIFYKVGVEIIIGIVSSRLLLLRHVVEKNQS